MPLVIATSNPGKLRELRSILPPNLQLVAAGDLGLNLPEETGATFAENALLKARAVATDGYIALADDSGLEIDALDGAPGIRSARYAGIGASHMENNAKVLAELRSVAVERRTARFKSVMALVDHRGNEHLGYGQLEGRITTAPRGTDGFGYDPIFEVTDPDAPNAIGRTLAELGDEMKNALSHRLRSVLDLMRTLEEAGLSMTRMIEEDAYGRVRD